MDPATMLSGPRGRRLCLDFALKTDGGASEVQELRHAVLLAAYQLDPGRGTSVMIFGSGADSGSSPSATPSDAARLVGAVSLAEPNERTLLAALAAAVDSARCWQEPDGEDVLASNPELQQPLADVATHISYSRHSDWWTGPMDDAAQWSVDFREGHVQDVEPKPSSVILEQWRVGQLQEEVSARHDRPTNPRQLEWQLVVDAALSTDRIVAGSAALRPHGTLACRRQLRLANGDCASSLRSR